MTRSDDAPPRGTPAALETTLADALVAALEQDGAPTAARHFTLDRQRAQEQLRRFQLPDPNAYVAELVAAAVVQGASAVEVSADADDLRLAFDGRPFALEDFDELYASLLSSEAGGGHAARRLLAVAVNGALALPPRWVRIESGDGTTGVWLEARPGEPDTFGTAEGLGPGTTVHVKQALRPRLLARLAQNLAGRLPEEQALRAHCRYCDVPVLLENERISGGRTLPDALCQVAVDTAVAQGTVAFLPAAPGRELRILQHGVWVTTLPLPVTPARPAGFVALVEAPTVHKDLSQRDVVRDAAYHALLEAVEEGFGQAVRAVSLRQDASEPFATRLLIGPEMTEAVTGAPCWDIATRPEFDFLALGQSPASLPCAVTSDGQVLGQAPEGWRPLPLPDGVGRVTAACVDREGPLALADAQGTLHHRLVGGWEQHRIQALGRGTRGTGKNATATRLHAFWARSPGDLFAVGDHGVILHFDGARWTAQPSGVSSRLRALWGPDNVSGAPGAPGAPLYAAGNGGVILRLDEDPGPPRWTIAHREHPDVRLAALWGSGPDHLFAAGRRYRRAPGGEARYLSTPVLLRYDGTGWRAEPLPGQDPVSAFAEDLLPGGALTDGAGHADAWGEGGLGALRALWGTGPGHALAAGNRGLLLRYDGLAWHAMDSGTAADLTGLWGTSPEDVVAAGQGGTMLHFGGHAWHPVLPLLVHRQVSLQSLEELAQEVARVALLRSGSRQVAADILESRDGSQGLCILSSLGDADLPRLARRLGRHHLAVR